MFASAVSAINRSLSVDAKAVGFVVFGLVMTVLGFLAHRFPNTFRGRGTGVWTKPATTSERASNRGFAVLFMIAGSAFMVAGVVVVR